MQKVYQTICFLTLIHKRNGNINILSLECHATDKRNCVGGQLSARPNQRNMDCPCASAGKLAKGCLLILMILSFKR